MTPLIPLRHRPGRARRRRDRRRPAHERRPASGRPAARARARRASRSPSTGKLAETLALLGATGAPGEVTKLATLGTVSAPVIAAVGLGPAPADGRTPRRCAGPRRPRSARWPARRRWRSRCRRPDGDGRRAPVAAGDRRGRAARHVPVRRLQDQAAARPARPGQGGVAARARRRRQGRPRPRSSGPRVVDARGRPHPRLGQHRAQRAAPAGVRRRRWRRRPAEAGLDVEVLDEKALKKGGYGGILAVGMGSEAPPRLVTISYAPKGATTKVALVGKGITFDTGGYAIKPAQGMWEMKSDMSGAAAVASAMIALAALKPKVAVTALPADGREHDLRHGVPARRRRHHVRRQAGRGAQHRRRGPHDPGRRDRPGAARTTPTTWSRPPPSPAARSSRSASGSPA